MSLTRLKARHSSQKRYLKSRQEEMAKPIEDTKPLPIILSWAYKILILVFFGLILIFPFYFMINESLLNQNWQDTWSRDSIIWYPHDLNSNKIALYWSNFKKALESGYGKAILFTAAITALSVVLRIFFSVTFGYAFAIKKWTGKNQWWGFFLMLLVLPEVALLAGQYSIVSKLNWLQGPQRVLALAMPFAASVFSGFMYRNAFEAIPNSVRESAMLDGASGFKFFTQIALPMVKPTTWTVAILTAFASWNSYTWPLVVLGKNWKGAWTVMNIWLRDTGKDPIDDRVYVNIRMAATILAILPMMIVYFVLRKRIMNAISRQGKATKG